MGEMLARAAMEKVLVVGTGLTGAVTASLLREKLPNSTQIHVWDKSRGAGGRMGTSRGPKGKTTVDLGAQYISSTPENYANHNRFFTELEVGKILEPLKGSIVGDKNHEDGTKHFVSPNGVGSVVKHFLKKSGAVISFNKQITDVSEIDGSLSVATNEGVKECYDCVILTMPVPQILQLNGTIKKIIDSSNDLKSKLSAVSYSSRFALGLFYDSDTKINVEWSAKYIYDDDCVRFVAIDDKKRNISSDSLGPSVCVHTSVPFSLKHLEEDKDKVGSEIILPRVLKIIPELPEPKSVKHHKWRYSQVHKPFEGQPGAICLSSSPLLVCGGDAFTSSGFDNCLISARTIVELIEKNLAYDES